MRGLYWEGNELMNKDRINLQRTNVKSINTRTKTRWLIRVSIKMHYSLCVSLCITGAWPDVRVPDSVSYRWLGVPSGGVGSLICVVFGGLWPVPRSLCSRWFYRHDHRRAGVVFLRSTGGNTDFPHFPLWRSYTHTVSLPAVCNRLFYLHYS